MPGVLRDNLNQIHIHGSRPDQIRYQLDGLYVTDPSSGGLGASIPIDAIESVDMDLANYSAEFGKASGGVVRVHSQFVGDKYKFNVTDFIPGWDFRQKSMRRVFTAAVVVRARCPKEALVHVFGNDSLHPQLSRRVYRSIGRTDAHINRHRINCSKLQWNLRESHVFHARISSQRRVLSGIRDSAWCGLARTQPMRFGVVPRSDSPTATSYAASFSKPPFNGRAVATAISPKDSRPMEVRPDRWLGNYYSDEFGRNQRFHSAATVAWDQETAGLRHHVRGGRRVRLGGLDDYLDRRPSQSSANRVR
jgi:hypothetical protein